MQLRRLSLLVTAWALIATPLAAGAQAGDAAYQLKPGDMLRISAWGEDKLDGTVLVAPDGSFAFPLVGHVDANGKTAEEIQDIVTKRLAAYISTPVVTVSIDQIAGNKFYIIGQVNQPGVYVMNSDVNVMQALSIARGTTAFASLDDIVVLRRGASGQVALPFKYSSVVRGRDLAQNINLQSGDIVVVP